MTNRVLAVLERRWAGWPASVAGVVAVAGVVVVDAAAAASRHRDRAVATDRGR